MKTPRASFHWIAGLVFLSAMLLSYVAPLYPGIVGRFDSERGPVEMLSGLFFLAASVVCVWRLVTGARQDRAWLYLWAAACFLFFGEETSWMQHVFGFSTPESIEAVNYQQEFNLHNLDALKSGSWHEFLTTGKFDYRILLGASTWFRVGFFGYFVLLPVLMHAGLLRGVRERFRIPLPSVRLVCWLCATLGLSLLSSAFYPEYRMEITEAREMYNALFILLYVVTQLGVQDGIPRTRTTGAI